MGHTRVQLVVKLLIRPVTPARAGAGSPGRTSPVKDTTVSQAKSHDRGHQQQPTTQANRYR
jgi:hypothetical protein